MGQAGLDSLIAITTCLWTTPHQFLSSYKPESYLDYWYYYWLRCWNNETIFFAIFMEDFKQNNLGSFVFTVPENAFVLYENPSFCCSWDNLDYLTFEISYFFRCSSYWFEVSGAQLNKRWWLVCNLSVWALRLYYTWVIPFFFFFTWLAITCPQIMSVAQNFLLC